MLRTKASTYAVLALVEIAKRQSGGPVGVQAAEIARCLHLPAAYAAKVLTQLARAGILRSDRGPRGGFRLAKTPETINLLQVIEIVDGVIGADMDVGGSRKEGAPTLYALDRLFDEIVALMRDALRQRTVADLLKRAQPVPSA